jgi:hypothetical protein
VQPFLRTLVTHLPPSALARDPVSALPRRFARSGARLAELRRTAEDLRDDPDVLWSSLLHLGQDGDALAEVASRSYAHPNGFIKIVLHLGDDYGVRLHVWYPQPPDWGADIDPHGHRWEFASWVVTGALHEETFVEADGGQWHDRFDYSRHDGTPNLLWTGTSRLCRVDHVERATGDVYARARSVIHTASPGVRRLVATLVLQGPTSFEPTPVFQPDHRLAHEETRLRPDELRTVLHDVAAVL